jgi:L-fuculose-phosphate aldolase
MKKQNDVSKLKNEIIEIGRKSVLNGYVTTVGGNISVRLDENQFLITSSGTPLDELTEENILIVDKKGISQERALKPSKETNMHLAIYQNRPDVDAVIHLHPILSTTLISIDEAITPVTMEELYFIGEKVGIVPLLAAGCCDLHNAVVQEAKKYNLVFLKNHGCISSGKNLKEAYYRIVKIERAAQATIVAKVFGKKIEKFPLLG